MSCWYQLLPHSQRKYSDNVLSPFTTVISPCSNFTCAVWASGGPGANHNLKQIVSGRMQTGRGRWRFHFDLTSSLQDLVTEGPKENTGRRSTITWSYSGTFTSFPTSQRVNSLELSLMTRSRYSNPLIHNFQFLRSYRWVVNSIDSNIF